MIDDNFTEPAHSSINSFIEKIENKKLLLPEFQRNFTWSVEQTVDLFDSIIRNIFIGALILSKPKFELTCREIDIRPRKGRGKNKAPIRHNITVRDFEAKNINVILDGQQRATSLFRAVKGYDELYFVFKPYLDLPVNMESVQSIEDIVDRFSSKPPDDEISISINDIYSSYKFEREKEIKEKILPPLVDKYALLLGDETTQERYFDLILKLRSLFKSILEDKTLLSVFLLDMNLDKFCLFFERSNSKGTTLNFIDIITAKIYNGFNLRLKKDEFKDLYDDNSLNNNQFIEVLVRYLSFLKNKAVDKKTILNTLNADYFNENWDEVCSLFVKAKKVLTEQRLLYRLDWLPNKAMLIPIMHLISNIPSTDFSQASEKKTIFFKFWFWYSLINSRYAGGVMGSTNAVIAEDCNLMEYVALNKKIPRELFRKFNSNFDTSELYDLNSNKGSTAVGIFSLMNYSNSFRELSNNELVDFKTEINVHHIFPKKYVDENFARESFEADNVNSILNKMVIGKISNIKFGKKSPSRYLSSPPMDHNSKLADSLKSHLIAEPEKLIQGTFDNNMEHFMELRRKNIEALINIEVNQPRKQILEWFF